MLSAEELERYARHIVLREIGGPGQQALKRARVLTIGAGGLGAPALLYLPPAGGGALRVIDDDAGALSHLQRQGIHGPPQIRGPPKGRPAAPRHRPPPPPRTGGAPRAAPRRHKRARADLPLRRRRRRLRQFRHALSGV